MRKLSWAKRDVQNESARKTETVRSAVIKRGSMSINGNLSSPPIGDLIHVEI